MTFTVPARCIPARLLTAAALGMLLLLAGCDHKHEATAASATTNVAGAAAADYVNTDGAPPPAIVAAALKLGPQAPKPTTALPRDAACVTPQCHARFTAAAHVHGPVSQHACDACHADDAGNHHYPLKRGKTETCTFCHASGGAAAIAGAPGAMASLPGREPLDDAANANAHVHAPIKDAGCTACHDPHASPAKFLLKADNTEQLCRKCHDVPMRKFAHEPFAKGDCTLCHEPHRAANAKLLRNNGGNELCFACHGMMRQQMATAAMVHEPARVACITCHNPHSTDNPRDLKAPIAQTCLTPGCHDKVKEHLTTATVKHAAMTSDRSCAACHTAHASNQKHLLADRTDKSCMGCHDKPVKTDDGRVVQSMKPVLASKFLHGPAKEGDCGACHDAHGSAHPNLLDRSFPATFYTSFDVKQYDLCFACHDQNVVLTNRTRALTNFRDGDQNLHFIHVNRDEKGRSCKTCHNVHGSDLPNHMAESVPFEGGNWAMPIDYQKLPTGGSCTPGCHKTRAYNRDAANKPATTTNPVLTTRGAS